MVTRFEATDEFAAAEFVDIDMSRAVFREVDLSGARMHGVLLSGADIDGDIAGLTLNGVEVAPLVDAELNRLHPERAKLRATSPEGLREAWSEVESFWGATMRRARALPRAEQHRSVGGEWSFVQTLRHLVFVTDAWLGRAVLGRPEPFHPIGLPASFMTDAGSYGIDSAADPTFDHVAEVRAGRMAQVAAFLAQVTQAELDRVRDPVHGPGWPPPAARTAIECLHVLLSEEWEHHRFAIRDLEAGAR